MRKESYDDLKARADKDNKELTVRMRLTTLQYRGHKADAVEKGKDASTGEPFRFELWDSMGAAGGILVKVWFATMGSQWVDVGYFEDSRPSEHDPLWYSLAYERLNQVRMAAYRAA